MKSRPSVLVLVAVTAVAVLLAGVAFGGVLSGGNAAALEIAPADEQPIIVAQAPSAPSTTVVPTTSTSSTTTTVPRTTTTLVATSTSTSSTTTTVPRTTTTVTVTTTVPRTTTTVAPAATTTTTVAPPTTTTTAAPVRTAGYDASAESRLVSLVNGVRASAGLPALASVGELRNYARGWAKHVGDAGALSHSNLNNVPGPWQSVGENVGFGPTADSVFDRLVASGGHYANMVNPTYRDVGIGVWADSDGTLWVVQIFRG